MRCKWVTASSAHLASGCAQAAAAWRRLWNDNIYGEPATRRRIGVSRRKTRRHSVKCIPPPRTLKSVEQCHYQQVAGARVCKQSRLLRYPRDAAMLARYLLSSRVCPSVTSRIKTANSRITQTMPHDSPGTLVLWCERSLRNSDVIIPSGYAKCRWDR